MALSLVSQYSTPFNIEKYKDDYSDELMKVIKARASGKKGKVRKLKIPETHTQDLMEQLKASLSKSKIS